MSPMNVTSFLKTIGSSTRTPSFSVCALVLVPTSPLTSSQLTTFFLSSLSVMRCGGFKPITPVTVPFWVLISTTLPTSVRSSMPPTLRILSEPSASILLTIRPSSSMCAMNTTLGPLSPSVTIRFPMLSSSGSRPMASTFALICSLMSSSNPDTPGTRISSSSICFMSSPLDERWFHYLGSDQRVPDLDMQSRANGGHVERDIPHGYPLLEHRRERAARDRAHLLPVLDDVVPVPGYPLVLRGDAHELVVSLGRALLLERLPAHES